MLKWQAGKSIPSSYFQVFLCWCCWHSLGLCLLLLLHGKKAEGVMLRVQLAVEVV